MKPRITLASAWTDCGWRYEWWTCSIPNDETVGFGPSKQCAYIDWLAKRGGA
jgi:hypothetical protein